MLHDSSQAGACKKKKKKFLDFFFFTPSIQINDYHQQNSPSQWSLKTVFSVTAYIGGVGCGVGVGWSGVWLHAGGFNVRAQPLTRSEWRVIRYSRLRVNLFIVGPAGSRPVGPTSPSDTSHWAPASIQPVAHSMYICSEHRPGLLFLRGSGVARVKTVSTHAVECFLFSFFFFLFP